jgi:tetratricopeptide (TPR) repeat protein
LLPGRTGAVGWRRAVAPAIFLVGLAAAVFPVTLHNLRAGERVLIAGQGGLNLWIGNNPQADGIHAFLPGLGTNWEVPWALEAASQAVGRPLNLSEADTYYASQALGFMQTDPAAAARLMFRKIVYLWNATEVSNNRDLAFFEHETSLLPFLRTLGFWLIGPLSLLGLWIARRERSLPGWFPGLVFSLGAGTVLWFVNARYRLPLIPFLLVAASIAVDSLWRDAKRQSWSTLRPRLALLTVLTVLVNVNPWGAPSDNPGHAQYSLGVALMRAGDLTGARDQYRRAIASDPSLSEVRLSLGILLQDMGDPAGAEKAYREEIGLNSRGGRAWTNLGALQAANRDLDEAVASFRRARELMPLNRQAADNLARSLLDLGSLRSAAGRREEAVALFAEAASINGSIPYRYRWALEMEGLGRKDQAIRELKLILTADPAFQPAVTDLARLTGRVRPGN